MRSRQAEQGLQLRDRQARVPAREQLDVDEDLVDRDPEAQRRDRQVRAHEPQRRKSHQHSDDGRDRPRNDQRQRKRHAPDAHVPEGEGADRDQR